jgi:hypothetical protein
MARIHGKNAYVYIQGAGAAAVQLVNAANYSLDVSYSNVDVSQLGDDWVQTLRGQGSWSGQVDGPVDTANTTVWDAATNASVRNMYLYPDKTNISTYYYGQAWFDVGIAGGVTKPVTFTAKLTGLGPLSTH